MSDGGRTHRPGQGGDSAPAHDLNDPNVAPRERGLFGASRMDAVRAERNEVAASLRNRLAVMRKSDGKATPAAIPEGGGAPLPGAVRSRMEPRLGADLSSVRVHASGESADAAKALGARAFTVGNDAHFGSGELAPGTKEGDKLLAHELTHVVQGQRSGIQRKHDESKDGSAGHASAGVAGGAAGHDAGQPGGAEAGGHEVSHPDEPAEKEADAKSEEVAGALHGDGKTANKTVPVRTPKRRTAKTTATVAARMAMASRAKTRRTTRNSAAKRQLAAAKGQLAAERLLVVR